MGDQLPLALSIHSKLAMAYQDAGRISDAVASYESLLAYRERELGAEHPNALAARNNLAIAYLEAGRAADAISTLKPLRTEFAKLLGPRHPHLLTIRSLLATAYDAAGRTSDAIESYEVLLLLADRQEQLGEDHPDTLDTRAQLERMRRTMS